MGQQFSRLFSWGVWAPEPDPQLDLPQRPVKRLRVDVSSRQQTKEGSMYSSDPFSSLPDELVWHIISQLPTYQERATCVLVCRRWARIARAMPLSPYTTLWVGSCPDVHYGMYSRGGASSGKRPVEDTIQGAKAWAGAVQNVGLQLLGRRRADRATKALVDGVMGSLDRAVRLELVAGPVVTRWLLSTHGHRLLGLSLLGPQPSLNPLASCSRLTGLYLRQTRCTVEDIRGLSTLPSLELLDFGEVPHLADLSPLSTLTRLQTLQILKSIHLVSLAPLGHCTSLVSLTLRDCHHVASVQALASCTRLEAIDLTFTDVRDISPLQACTHMKSVKLELVETVEALCECLQVWPGLTELSFVADTVVTDLAFMRHTPRLVHLALHQASSLVDVSQAVQISTLRGLDIEDCNQVANSHVLADIPNLRELLLWGCHNADVCTLEAFSRLALTRLALTAATHLTSIAALSACTTVEELCLDYTNFEDLSPLAHCVRLCDLRLVCCSFVKDLSPLSECVSLTGVELEDCGFTTVEALSHCPNLVSLVLRKNVQFTDTSSVAGCRNLMRVDLEGPEVLSIEGVGACTRLMDVSLATSRVTDLSPLAQLPVLASLSLVDNTDVNDLSPLLGCPRLALVFIHDSAKLRIKGKQALLKAGVRFEG